MKKLLIVAAVVAVAAAACSSDDSDETDAAANEGAAVAVADSDLGQILTDGDGNTLYLFLPDEQGESVCTEACAEAWPPFTESATAGDGVDAALLGTAARADGTTQTTYNGWPLYHFANDEGPGDTNGQNVNDVWFVVTPEGNAGG